MTAKKIIMIIASVIIVLILLFVFMLYVALKTKSTNIDKYEPFKSLIDKTVTLNTETVLFKENDIYNNQYPYTLVDNLHTRWEWFNSRMENPNVDDIKKIATLPIGTKLKIEKAIMYKTGVSGSSYPVLFGVIEGTEYKINYQWGKKPDFMLNDWRFNKAPWQKTQDTALYTIPDAKF